NDTLIGISQAVSYGVNDRLVGSNAGGCNLSAWGTDDILTGGNGSVTTNLRGHANGSTLIAGTGTSVAFYSDDDAVLNLYWGTAAETGAAHTNDTLIGITVATVTGDGSTIFGGGGVNTLTAAGTGDTLINDAWADTLIGGTGVSGAGTLIAAGTNDTLIGGTGASILVGTAGAKLFGVSGHDTLLGGDTGTTTLIGDGGGETLIGGAGAELALLQVDGSADHIYINLANGVARQIGGTND